jgi:hypothetical protein
LGSLEQPSCSIVVEVAEAGVRVKAAGPLRRMAEAPCTPTPAVSIRLKNTSLRETTNRCATARRPEPGGVIIVVSATISAVVGLLWLHVTVGRGGGAYCEGPPGKVACINYPPSWDWIAFVTLLGAVLGSALALVGLKLSRLNERRKEHDL